jgi:dTDP-4-amino-4,6-dideoxygalactose transaminase
VRAFNSGTATLEVALRLAKVGAGDTVITTPLTWVATANVILEVGATPVLVDVDPVTRNIDLDRIEAAILPNTKRHHPGRPRRTAGRPRPAVCHRRQAQSARDRGCRAIPRRIMERQADRQHRRLRLLQLPRQQEPHHRPRAAPWCCRPTSIPASASGCACKGVKRFPDGGMDVDVLGGKFNLTDIAAAIGLGQMKQLAGFTARRRELARRYFARIDPALGLGLPVADFGNSNWHMFQVLLPAGADRGRSSRR